ncbi:hypothetical protein OCK74_26155 [Chitinophagaceae bacterium LB-8]|uniref:Uncharacterized protein n=1 Tax=Paraflavisolibacter caeni TaxID=2982496 RepID=A0A9X2Y0D7_9BACT|nr:hypothetical protein [Paraflavisolibacter caeni]MCU7552630.1 hypothetical protein [Paraflavisolibacter caeni]
MTRIKKAGLIGFCFLLTSISASAQNKIDFSPLNDLVKRQIPSL